MHETNNLSFCSLLRSELSSSGPISTSKTNIWLITIPANSSTNIFHEGILYFLGLLRRVITVGFFKGLIRSQCLPQGLTERVMGCYRWQSILSSKRYKMFGSWSDEKTDLRFWIIVFRDEKTMSPRET